MSIISIGIPIPDRSALPGQTGSGEEVNLQYVTQNYCNGTGVFTPTVATPAGGVFTDNSSDPNLFQVNPTTGTFNLGVSDPGNYTVTYTVNGDSANFPINIGAVVDTTITGDSATCIGFAPSPSDLTAVSGYSNYEWFKDNVSVQNGTSNTYTPAFNVAGSFVYKVIITDSSLGISCAATSSNFAFTVNALPTITIINSGGGFCSGSSTVITTTVSAGTIFAWYKDNVLISGQTASSLTVTEVGEYTATVTDSNGCTSLISNGLDIEQFDSPSVTITTVPGTTICSGDTATLTANPTGGTGPYVYSWSTGVTTQAISVTTSATYTVTVTDANTCTATASQAITASTAATSIASINNDAAISFNGVDSYVDTTSINLGVNATATMWFRPNVGGSTDYTLFGEADNFFQYLARRSNNLFYVWIGSGAVSGSDYIEYTGVSSNIITGEWNFISLVKTGGTVVVYLKNSGGEFSESKTSSAWATRSMDFDRIGARTGGSGTSGRPSFNGSIDEVAAWSTSLSSCDIKGIYEATTTVSGQPKSANLLDANTTIPAPVYWNRMGDS